MASEDGSINIKTKIDTSDTQSQVGGLKGQLKGLGSSGILKGVTKIAPAVAAIGAAAKVTTKVIKETTAAYKVQATAEKQLELAARNNPYLNSEGVNNLKQFASSLQSISTVGDEAIIPLMARLAAAGRTQAEIQNILTAAVDMSAAGVMSLDAAVTSLNATYNGNTGALARQYAELKGLTDEELKNGKAVEIMGAKFKGMAQEVSATTGTSEKLKNAWGDLKEELGANFEKQLIPVRNYFTKLLSDIATAKAELRKQREYEEGIAKGTADATDNSIIDYQKQVNEIQAQKNKLESELRRSLANMGYTDEKIKNELKTTPELVRLSQQLATARENLANANKKLEKSKTKAEDAKRAAELAAAAQAEAEAIKTRDGLRAQYDETIRQAQAEIKQRRILGETITEQQEAQELLNVGTEAYIKMMADPAFIGNSGNYEHEVNARKELAKWAQLAAVSLEEEGAAFEKSGEVLEEIKNYLGDENGGGLVDTIDATINALEFEMQALEKNSDLWREYYDRIAALTALKSKVVAKAAEDDIKAQRENLAQMFATVQEYTAKFGEIVNGITDAIETSVKRQQSNELTDIAEQYTEGLISYEEYCDKKAAINKKAAQEQYKIELWNWTSSLATATANIAQGVSKAIAEGGTMGIVTGAIVAASGAAQIASIAANKPVRPSFYTGGVVDGIHGASLGKDTTTANVRRGEMILNAAQQLQLWKTANGQGGGGTSLKVNVINNRGADTNINTKMTAHGLQITIDKVVNNSMSKGRYNSGLAAAQIIENGVNIL